MSTPKWCLVPLWQAVTQLLEHFDAYQGIPKMDSLRDQVAEIRAALRTQARQHVNDSPESSPASARPLFATEPTRAPTAAESSSASPPPPPAGPPPRGTSSTWHPAPSTWQIFDDFNHLSSHEGGSHSAQFEVRAPSSHGNHLPHTVTTFLIWQVLAGACAAVDALGPDVRREMISWFSNWQARSQTTDSTATARRRRMALSCDA